MKKSSFSEVRKCLETLLKKGVDKSVFSGAAAGVYIPCKKGGKKIIFCTGKTRNNEGALPVQETTFFDLASLTKPFCTVLSILHLIEKKKINFDTPLHKCIEGNIPCFLKKIKIAHLLSHSSGLISYMPYYMDFKPIQGKYNKNKLLEYIFKEEPVQPPGIECLYSDIGYILLGEAVENISGSRLNDFFTSSISEPLGLQQRMLFRPVEEFGKKREDNIAATRLCPWRKRLLQGEVDDEHSWLLNGVAGHAGLFATINGVLEMCIHILHQWKGREEHPSYKNRLMQKILTRQNAKQTWCLGFDTPSPVNSSGGVLLSKHSVGHLGFTGTSFWIDPEKDVVVVLLTNRVHPDRNNDKIKKFRPLLHDTVLGALLKK